MSKDEKKTEQEMLPDIVETPEELALDVAGIEDDRLMQTINLPTYSDVTDQKVLKSVRDLFKGFDFDPTGNIAAVFEKPESLSGFIQRTFDEISRVTSMQRGNVACSNAAAMSRLWYMSNYLNRALDQGAYGTAVYNKLHQDLGISVGYIYQLRAISTNLSVTDCYLLGLRGITSSTLRRLAYKVKDADKRKAMIKAFVDELPKLMDTSIMERAKRKFIAAINGDSAEDFEAASTTDPSAGGAGYEVSPEYDDLKAHIELWTKMLKKPSQDEPCETFCNAAANFYIGAYLPEAEKHLATMKENIASFKAIIATVKNNLDDIVKELESVEKGSVLQNEDGNEPSK